MADDRTYDPASGRYLTPYEIRMKTLSSRDAAANSGVETVQGGSMQDSFKDTNKWYESDKLRQNEGVTGLAGSEMEGTKVGTQPSGDSGAGAGANAVAQGMGSGQSGVTTAGQGMTAAGAASLNPYLTAAGLAVTAVGSAQDGKKKRQNEKYLNEVRKYENRQLMLSKLASIGSGLKA